MTASPASPTIRQRMLKEQAALCQSSSMPREPYDPPEDAERWLRKDGDFRHVAASPTIRQRMLKACDDSPEQTVVGREPYDPPEDAESAESATITTTPTPRALRSARGC